MLSTFLGFVFAEPTLATSVSLKAIEDTWRKRQTTCKRVHISWKETHYLPRGVASDTISSLPASMARRENPDGQVAPPQDTVIVVQAGIWIKGEQLRYESAPPQWSFVRKEYITNKTVVVFNGKNTNSVLSTSDLGHKLVPTGAILPARHHFDPEDPKVRPVLLTYRGVSPFLRPFPLSHWVITPRRASIRGVQVVELEKQNPRNGFVQRMWLDPNREFLLVRFVLLQREALRYQLDIQYRSDKQGSWIPDSWQLETVAGPTRKQHTIRATVENAVINGDLNQGVFTLAFPPGTQVVDTVRKRRYTVAGSTGTAAQLFGDATSAGPGERQDSSRSLWIFVALGGLIALALGAILIQARRGRQRPSRTSVERADRI